jgi:hypothetical protein
MITAAAARFGILDLGYTWAERETSRLRLEPTAPPRMRSVVMLFRVLALGHEGLAMCRHVEWCWAGLWIDEVSPIIPI